MEPEIELERFAALCAEVEAGTPLEQLLRTEGLSDDAWARSRDTWMGRMSSEPDAERKLLEARYKSSFDARRRVIEARTKGAGGEATGVDDAPTPPRGQPMAIGLMDTVPMLPSADPEQLLARLRARRAAAAGQAGGGSASDPSQAMPARGESTPPMRPRSALVPDDAMQAASDAMSPNRTTPPTPAGSGKPALPFQTPAKLPPPPPAPPRSPPRPPPLPSAASSFPTTTPAAAGGYPPVPPPASSSPGGSGPGAPAGATPQAPPPQSTPMSLAGFSSTSSGPRLTLERYAAFAAEIAVHPAQLSDIRTKYGLNDSGHTAESEAWQRRFSADRETYVRYATLFQHYRDWFSTRGPR